MPERGWYSLTVREETAKRVRELARERGLTVDMLINQLIMPASKDPWLTCNLCGARVKAEICRSTWPEFILKRLEDKESI